MRDCAWLAHCPLAFWWRRFAVWFLLGSVRRGVRPCEMIKIEPAREMNSHRTCVLQDRWKTMVRWKEKTVGETAAGRCTPKWRRKRVEKVGPREYAGTQALLKSTHSSATPPTYRTGRGVPFVSVGARETGRSQGRKDRRRDARPRSSLTSLSSMSKLNPPCHDL